MENIDTEEINSALDADCDIYGLMTVNGKLLVKREEYTSVSNSRYDSVNDRLIFSTSVQIKAVEDHPVRAATTVDVIQKLHRDAKKGKKHHIAPLHPPAKSSAHGKKAQKTQKAHRHGPDLVIPSAHGAALTMPLAEADKYFGEDARSKFFDQYRAMAQNVHSIAPNGINSRYASESRLGTASTADMQLFTQRTDLLDDSSYLDSLNEPSYNNLTATGSVCSALQSLPDGFFTDLQSISSNQRTKFAVDKDLLGTQSFGTYKKSHEVLSGRRTKPPRIGGGDSVVSRVSMWSDNHTRNSTRLANNHIASDALNSLSLLNAQVVGSPRTRYLSGCLRDGLQPLPNLVVRRTFSSVLDLSHFSIGDKMGRVLAECLKDLPCLETINLNDNNLTDDSLQFLIEAIICIKSVRELDLSRNKIDGQSSDALAEYVSRKDCPLIKLTLQHADVDDGECDRFVQCLVSNEQLLELDLSSNLLGSAEFLNSVGGSEERTGGVAIAEFIQSASCRLQVLKLGWNAIRAKSAVTLTAALAFNHTLTYLDLNNNGIGYAAGEVLGDAIMENRTLRTLLVSGNNLTATACVSICIGIVENFALTYIEMNDNPIGDVGVRIIMLISVALGSRLTLHAKNCNTIATDDRCTYNPSQPCGQHTLNLSKPFDRAVAFHLLHVAATHNSFIISSAIYEASKGSSQPLKLVQSVAHDRETFFDEDQKKNIAGLRLVVLAASNTQLAHKLFFEADADLSGKLDKDELQEVLNKIGFVIEEDRLHDIMAVFDVDGEGTIELPEFMSLLKSQQREANLRIRDLTEYPIMALAGALDKKFIPPRTGILHVKLIDGFVQKKKFYTISSIDQKYAYNMAKGMGDVSMVTEAVKHTKVRYDEAYSIYKSVYSELRDKAGTLIKVLPLMTNPSDARQLVTKVTNDSRVELTRIKLSFGVTFRPMLGSFNGYYCLDLSKELHRICLSKLLLESQTLNSRRSALSIMSPGKVGDTSQTGNWSCFRNEVFNGKRIVTNPKKFTPMPQTGILEFDFSGAPRPTGGELKLSDRRLCKALQNICLLKASKQEAAVERLGEMKRRAHETNKDGTLFMPMYAFSVAKALEIGRYTDDFYDNLEARQKMNRAGAKKEEVSLYLMKGDDQAASAGAAVAGALGKEPVADTSSDTTSQHGDGQQSARESVADDASVGNTVTTELTNDLATDIGTNASATSSDDDDDEDTGGQYVSAHKMLEMRQRRIADQRRRLQKLLQSTSGISKQAKAKRLVEVLDETFNQLWIYSRHLALIVSLFRDILGTPSRCKHFGSYAAELVVCLFSRVVDLHNFELVWEVLDAADCSAVLCRIGILNVFNPLKPEVSLELCMDRREERIVAKCIVYLSVVEPGLNLTFKSFQWKRDQDTVPGWDVTEPWMTEAGMSAHGYFAFTYYSGEGKNKSGCVPDLFLRKALTAMVLIDENEIVAEDAGMPETLINTASTHYENYRDVWANYLTVFNNC